MRKTKVSMFLSVGLVLVISLISFSAIAKSENSKSNKTEKTSFSQGKEKPEKLNLRNYEKADKAAGKTDVQVHKEKVQSVVRSLKQVANQEKVQGNTKATDELQQLAQEQEQIQEETVQAIEKIEKRGKVKTFLIGADYKNLGQLRSNLVRNRNQIRQLTRTMAQVQNEEDRMVLQEQLKLLMQERERIKEIISTNESHFSLFGWVSRFLANYEAVPVDNEEEQQLVDEVESAINNTTTGENQEFPSPDSE